MIISFSIPFPFNIPSLFVTFLSSLSLFLSSFSVLSSSFPHCHLPVFPFHFDPSPKWHSPVFPSLSLYLSLPNLSPGVTKRCLSWLTNSALVYEPKCGRSGGGGFAGLSRWVQLYTLSPNKLWRYKSYLTYGCPPLKLLLTEHSLMWRGLGWATSMPDLGKSLLCRAPPRYEINN